MAGQSGPQPQEQCVLMTTIDERITDYIEVELEIETQSFCINGYVIETLDVIEGITHNGEFHGTDGFIVCHHQVSAIFGGKTTTALSLWFKSETKALLSVFVGLVMALLEDDMFDENTYKRVYDGT